MKVRLQLLNLMLVGDAVIGMAHEELGDEDDKHAILSMRSYDEGKTKGPVPKDACLLRRLSRMLRLIRATTIGQSKKLDRRSVAL